jgi:polysaccharide export outer membrane protein
MVYFGKSSSSSNETPVRDLIYASGDMLSITVMGRDLDAAKPFNIPSLNYSANQGGYATGTPAPPGYLIDAEGNIDFPVLGKIKVGGLTHAQAIQAIQSKLESYLKEPTILIRLINFRVSVLGEVRNPGTFTLPNETVTLVEALGIAGDLTITGKRTNVLVVRTVNGKRSEIRLDLTTTDVFSSPAYYLQQNDVIYIEPNRAKINSAVVNPANVGIVISVLSLLVTMTVLLSK